MMASSILYAQKRHKEIQMDSTFAVSLGPNLTNLYCHVIIREPETIVNNCIVLYRFDFYKALDSTLVLSYVNTKSVHILYHYDFKIEDFNNDGYKDISFVTDETAKAVEYWSVFLFDPKTKRFTRSEKYSKFVF